MTQSKQKQWFALYTKSRAEKRVYNWLQEKGIETYLPLEKKLKQWSDRKKWVEEPLIRSYIFVHVQRKDLLFAVQTPGVVWAVKFRGQPEAIPEAQINAIKLLLNADAPFEVSVEHFAKGEKVEVSRGKLKGLRGELIEHVNQKKVLIRLETIQQNILVHIHPAFLDKLQPH
jgi:transcription antitermination factor NusG